MNIVVHRRGMAPGGTGFARRREYAKNFAFKGGAGVWLAVFASLLTGGCGAATSGEAPSENEPTTEGFFCFELDPGESPRPDADPRCPAGTG